MKKGLGIGIQDYRTLIEKNGYFVDKSLMIREFLNDLSEVTLITRPRRFGKTLNMSMLAEFLDITKDAKAIFDGKKIMDTEVSTQINQFPVIFLSFKDAKGDRINAVKLLKKVIYSEYRRYDFIWETLESDDRADYDFVMEGLRNRMDGDLTAINDSIQLLCQFLYRYYKKKVILLIDEYDMPFIEAHLNGYYEEIHASLAAILSTALKGNEFLEKAMLTGIQRIAKENIFSGANNYSVYGVDQEEYAAYFGLLEEETKELLEYYGLKLNTEVKTMYDGYRIGDMDIYNPWSIINYARKKKLLPYWVNTGSNMMLKKAMSKSSRSFAKKYEDLIEKNTIVVNAYLETSYYEDINDATLWAMLINSGYLTILKTLGLNSYEVKIPNDEVKENFKDLTLHYLHVDHQLFDDISLALMQGEIESFIEDYKTYLMETASYHDLQNENSYQAFRSPEGMLMLGLCAFLSHSHKVTSNREAGKGRYDIMLESKCTDYPSYIMEFKYTKDTNVDLKVLAQKAVSQMVEKRYDFNLKGNIIYIGLAHCQKDVEIIFESSYNKK